MYQTKSQISALNSQEEGNEDLTFKMVFVVNMDLAMGVGKVSRDVDGRNHLVRAVDRPSFLNEDTCVQFVRGRPYVHL